MSAGARVHRRKERETRREPERFRRPRDRDESVLERLAQRLEGAAGEFGKFVEKKNAVVGERDFTRPRVGPAADERCIRYRVMRRPERAGPDQNLISEYQPGYAVDLRCLERLLESHIG